MARLDRLRVEGYKSIAEADLILGDLNVLIGANGAGKSNLLGALGLLGSIVDQRLQLTVGLSGGVSGLLHRAAGRSTSMHFEAVFRDFSYETTLLAGPDDGLVFGRETFYLGPDNENAKVWGPRMSGARESVLMHSEHSDKLHAMRSFRETVASWRVCHFDDTGRSASAKLKQPVDDNEALRADGANLAPLLYRIERTHPENFRWIVDTVRLVAPFFRNFRLRPDRVNSDVIQLEWEQNGTTDYFGAASLSDGTLRFILLMTLLLQPEPPSLIIIDEPELGLHPFAITLLADALRSCATSRQVIVSTQSVTLLNRIDPQDVIVAENVSGSSTFRRPDWAALEAWLSDYSVGELWEKNLIGGRPS